jgi:shikimate dehydrogenase
MTSETAAASTLGLIGSHASSAMSPALWNPVFSALGNGWTYVAWDVAADGDLVAVRERLIAPTVVAFNVTMPHKHWAAETADESSPVVDASGAANLLVRCGSRLEAHNTDIDAMVGAFASARPGPAVILGAGGAGRAALVALAGHPGPVLVADGSAGAADELVRFAQVKGLVAKAVEWSIATDEVANASIVVNATPIGQHEEDEPAWGSGGLAKAAVLYDFVYAPHATASVEAARRTGATIIDGWQHLLMQAEAMVPILGLPRITVSLLEARLTELRR